MIIRDIKINGVEEPIGFYLEEPVLSFKVEDTQSKRAESVAIRVVKELDKTEVYTVRGADLKQKGVTLKYTLEPRTAYVVEIDVRGDVGDEAQATTRFETGKLSEKWDAAWISPKEVDAKGSIHPILHREFDIKKPVRTARFYGTGVGAFETYVNGEKLGKEYLAPFNNHFETYLQVLTFPVDSLKVGKNQWDILLGKGWYMGEFGLEGSKDNYGDRMAALGELILQYEDGSVEKIVTDDRFVYTNSDIVDSGIYFGEIVDRTIGHRIGDLVENASMDVEWKPVEVMEHPEETAGTENLNLEHLMDRISPRLQVQEELQVQEVIHTPAGETVLDFGQNFAGFVRFKAAFPKGTKIVLDFGEILQNGNFYRDNYREAKSQFVYYADGSQEMVAPHFTYFGFRYIKVTGWPGQLQPQDFVGCALYSEMDQTGYLHTNNEKINRLIENTLWGLKSNFLDLPTDCPQRNERLGWTGDAQVFSPTACYHMDTRAFYHKFTTDLRREQVMLHGAVPNYIPNIGHKDDAGSVWGDVATFLPYTLQKMFGDTKELECNYALMKDWVSYIHNMDQARGEKNLFDFGFHFGDWLALDGISEESFKGSTEDGYIGSMYYARSAEIVANTAEKLGI